MFIRLQHLITAAILGLGSAVSAQAAGAGPGPGPGNELCIEDTQVDHALGVALGRLVATTAVTVRGPEQCAGARLVGRFSGLDPVVFTLHTAGGERFARAVPWLIRPDAGLSRLRAQRRLSAFAVLLQGLLAEWRIAAGTAQEERPPVAAPDAGAPAAPATRRGRARPAARARRGRGAESAESAGTAESRDIAPGAGAEGSPAESPETTGPALPETTGPALLETTGPALLDQPSGTPDELPLVPVDEPGVSMAVEASPYPLLAEEPPVATAADAPARWRLEIPHVRPPAAPAPGRPPSSTPAAPAPARLARTAPDARAGIEPRAGIDAGAEPHAGIESRAEPRAGVESRAGIDAGAEPGPSRPIPWPSPEVMSAVRVRQSATLGVELGAALSWRSLFASGARQLPARWELEGRPIQLDAVVLAAGYRPVLYRAGAWRIQLTLAANIERLSLRRTDLDDARPHAFWDPGVAVGGALTRDIGGWLRARVELQACRQLGRTVRIPDGPEAAFNHRGGRVTLSLAWLP